jgi:protein O-GlcNAc transferase
MPAPSGQSREQFNHGLALLRLGRLDEAEQCLAAAVRLEPDFAPAHNNRGIALADLGRWSEAEDSYRQALALDPGYAFALNNLGNLLQAHGRFAEAERSYRQALDLPRAYSNLLFMLNYMPERGAADIHAEHVRFGQRFAGAAERPPHPNPPQPDRPLRVGYVSADLRQHSVGYFIEPVLANHDRRQFTVYCYYNHAHADGFTARLKAATDQWREVPALNDDALADQVRRDGIDILVDLSGHSAQNRLLAFARKPAPVQVTWLGYLNTTGLGAMDYRVTDPRASPEGMFESFHTERLVRLPDSQWCYQPPADCPEVAPSPCGRAGQVTFAAFANPAKFSEPLLKLWAHLLERVPNSRLLVVPATFRSIPADYATRFVRAGIPPARMELRASLPAREYFAMHGTVDLILDTHPYSGGTTTCHAFWMGVPVVTLAGNTASSRGGASLLHAVGLGELIAETPEQYVDIAAMLAADRERLARLRAALRERMRASPLMDGRRFALNLERAYRGMWQAWCESRGR